VIAKVRAGLRIAGNDVIGDIEADNFMDIIEEGSAAAGMRLERHPGEAARDGPLRLPSR
jgi:hypothetical protein